MFSLPWKKRPPSILVNQPIETEIPSWLKPLLNRHGSLSKPDWHEIGTQLETRHDQSRWHEAWVDVAHAWLKDLTDSLKHNGSPDIYHSTESANFILISSKDARFNKVLCEFLERCRRRLIAVAKGIIKDEGLGKHVVIVFGNIDSYYDYVAQYGPEEGTYGLSSGMYLNYGYGHFVFQQDSLEMAEPIAAHEMTHALLAHLPIPNWLNEGLAVNMEGVITGRLPETINRSYFELHQTFWNSSNIQKFWQGDSFFSSDEGQKLSYQLAQILVTNLSKDYELFVQFANNANYQDSGEAAMQRVYGLSLGDLAAGFLGDGDWSPNSRVW